MIALLSSPFQQQYFEKHEGLFLTLEKVIWPKNQSSNISGSYSVAAAWLVVMGVL